jgi:hypothetical protein
MYVGRPKPCNFARILDPGRPQLRRMREIEESESIQFISERTTLNVVPNLQFTFLKDDLGFH